MRKRSRASASGSMEAMNLTATGRSSSVSWASQTWPIPPWPSCPIRRYSSNSWGGIQCAPATASGSVVSREDSNRPRGRRGLTADYDNEQAADHGAKRVIWGSYVGHQRPCYANLALLRRNGVAWTRSLDSALAAPALPRGLDVVALELGLKGAERHLQKLRCVGLISACRAQRCLHPRAFELTQLLVEGPKVARVIGRRKRPGGRLARESLRVGQRGRAAEPLGQVSRLQNWLGHGRRYVLHQVF